MVAISCSLSEPGMGKGPRRREGREGGKRRECAERENERMRDVPGWRPPLRTAGEQGWDSCLGVVFKDR